MKIAYLLATRGNPLMAGATIELARLNASGKHEIEFLIGADRDDKATIKYFWNHYPDITVSVADRSPTLGSVWNRLAACSTADAFCPLGDHVFIVSPNWDEAISKFCPQGSVSIVAFTDSATPQTATYPVISRGWYELAGLYTDYFPFWFDDTWIEETWQFMTGQRIYISNQLQLLNKHTKTRRMRDLRFWWSFFAALRPERMAIAARIRKAVGVEPLTPALLELVRREWELRDDRHLIQVDEIQMAFGGAPQGAPSSEYLVALDAAKTRLRQLSVRAA
jgi:hypothetical protein